MLVNRVGGGGGGSYEDKTVTAGTSTIIVEASQGKSMRTVTVNPTPSEEKVVTAGIVNKDVTPTNGKYLSKVTVKPTPSHSESVTPTTSQQIVTPYSGCLLSSVTVDAIQTETKSIQAGTSTTEVTPTSGKYLSKVTVRPTPSQTKTVIPTPAGSVVTPSSGYFLSQVTLNPFDLAGQNVWKKCNVSSTSESVSNILFTASPEGGNSMYFPLPTDTYPFLGSLTNWVDFFDGFTIYRSSLDFTLSKVGNELHLIRNNEDKGAMSYENGVIGFPFGWGSTNDAEFVYSGTKTAQYEGKGTFIEFVVSDDVSEYPDGGVKDGYWYENTVPNGIVYKEVNSEGYPTEVYIKLKEIASSTDSIFYCDDVGDKYGDIFKYAENITIEMEVIPNASFRLAFCYFSGKLKLKKVKELGSGCFRRYGTTTTSLEEGKQRRAVFIPKSCTTISGASYNTAPFYDSAASNITAYCEVEEKPSGWGTYWDCRGTANANSRITVVWGVTEAEFDAL